MTHPVKPQELSVLRFDRIWVREAVFVDSLDDQSPPAPEDLAGIGISLEVRAEPGGRGDRAFVTVRAVLEPPAGKALFLKLSAAVEGAFSLQPGTDPERLRGFASLQAPVLLLPYLRQVITDLTAQSRLGALVLPPINMAEVTRAMREEASVGRPGAARSSSTSASR
jgi:preprotein translocase subunit SecB